MTDLRTLDDHNRSALEAFTLSNRPCPNGIACPKCGQELVDSNPSVCLTSWPPQYSVHCLACEYNGYRN